MFAIRNRRNGKLWADEAGWQDSGGMVVWLNSVQEARQTIEEELRESTVEIVDEKLNVVK